MAIPPSQPGDPELQPQFASRQADAPRAALAGGISRRPRSRRAALAIAGLVAVALLMFLRGLGSFGLMGPDEPRYAEIAAEMATAHDYVTPRLLAQPWFEKPVLYYWLAAASDVVWGVSDASARLPNALLGLLLALALGFSLARLRCRRAGILAAMFALTAAFLFGFAHAASTDMPLTATLSLCLLSLYFWLRPQSVATEAMTGGAPQPRVCPAWLWLAAVGLGLAVLAKGPVAMVLAGGVLVIYALRYRRLVWIRRALSPAAIGIFLAVCGPWYVWVSIRNPSFPRVFFWQHNFQRFATNRFEHAQPFWFFLPVLFIAVFPWSGWSLLPLRNALKRLGRPDSGCSDRFYPSLELFLWLWVLVPLVFFSASHSKLPGYILPAVPGLVALMAVAIDAYWRELPRWPALISAVLTGLIPACLLAFPWLFTPKAWRPPATYLLRNPSLWIAGLGTMAVLAILAWRRSFIAYFALTCAYVVLGSWALTGPFSPRIDAVASARPLAAAIRDACGSAAFVPLPLPTAARTTAPFASGPCAGATLYQWNLSREMVYGLGFYLHRDPVSLTPPAVWPAKGLVAVDRRQMDEFMTAAVQHGLKVGEGSPPPLGANWALLEFSRR